MVENYITIVGTDCTAVASSTGGAGPTTSTGPSGAASSLAISGSSLLMAAFAALFAQRM